VPWARCAGRCNAASTWKRGRGRGGAESAGCIDRGLASVRADLEPVRADVGIVARANACLDRCVGPYPARLTEFDALAGKLKHDPAPRRRGMGE